MEQIVMCYVLRVPGYTFESIKKTTIKENTMTMMIVGLLSKFCNFNCFFVFLIFDKR